MPPNVRPPPTPLIEDSGNDSDTTVDFDADIMNTYMHQITYEKRDFIEIIEKLYYNVDLTAEEKALYERVTQRFNSTLNERN